MDRVIAGRYRVLDPLGAGGSSQVYLAHDATLGRDVAIKVLDDRASSQDELKRMFTKEGRALAQLSHPNIVAVHDVGEVDGRPYIVMERVEGVSLKQRIERSGPLPVPDAIRMGIEIATGLEAAHSRGIVHADLKPSNILLDRDEHAKICDFGIARTPQEDAETPQLYATALYVAPERVEGKRATVGSDIYGLGLVLYEMLVGRPPFTSASAGVLLRDHVVRQPVPPSHLRPSLPREFDTIVLKALAKDPALRYRKASELAAALAKVPEASAALGGTRGFVTEPIQDFVPQAAQSPVVHVLSTYGGFIRSVFFGVLAALPVFGLVLLGGFDVLLALGIAGIVAAVGFLGQLGIALVIAWVVETAIIFLFVPGLAVLFAFMGIFAWLREVKAEQTALALAMPVSAPFGLAPALALSSVAIHGLSGVITVAWGAVLTLVFAIASGRQSFGPFAQTGLTLQQESLFGPVDAAESRSALLAMFSPPQGHSPWEAIGGQLAPEKLISEMGSLVSRTAAADVTGLANVLAWVVAGLAVWAVTRLLRALFDALLRRRAWFALYVFATALGVTSGALLLYMLFVTVSPLASAPGRIADDVLFLSAVTGAVLAIAVGVVISATEPHEHEDEHGPAMSGRRVAVR